MHARQWSIPWGARVELKVGPFVGLRLYENQGEFTCLFLDEGGRYYHVAIGLRQQEPQLTSSTFAKWSSLSDEVSKERAAGEVEALDWDSDDDSRVTLQLVAAAVVRDFLVVEERESVFSTRVTSQRTGTRQVQTVVYLPRVHYHRPMGPLSLPEEPRSIIRSRHQVLQHLRRAGTASAEQRFIAQRYGVHLPKGFTFVRPHERGTAAREERAVVYRSRSASRMLFEAIDFAPTGNRPAWFDFEKDCARMLRRRGLVVRHQAGHRDGDGGVDLYATDKDGLGWVVQCKCWGPRRPVGPEVVRELHGAIASADAGATATSRGILITTSTFTSGPTFRTWDDALDRNFRG